MARLPRLSNSNTGLDGRSPPRTFRKVRHGSPSGGSIFTTSAPQSARMPAAPGPATQTPSSTTLTPSNGPLMVREPASNAGARAQDDSRTLDRIPVRRYRPAPWLASLDGPARDRLAEVGGFDHARRLRLGPRRALRDVVAHGQPSQSTDCTVLAHTEERERDVLEVAHGVRVRDAVDVVVADSLEVETQFLGRERPGRVRVRVVALPHHVVHV